MSNITSLSFFKDILQASQIFRALDSKKQLSLLEVIYWKLKVIFQS